MENLIELLKKPYSHENWLKIIEATFTNVSITAPSDIPYDKKLSDKIESYRQFGTVTLADGNRLPLIELKVSERIRLRQNRVQLRQLIAKLIDHDKADGVLAVFDTGLDNYRFSFTAKESEFNEDGEYVEHETDKKRFTYVLGRNEQTRTAAEQFARLCAKGNDVTLKDVVAAFNVEPITKDFFNRYKKFYEDFVQYITGKRFEKINGKWKEIKINEPSIFHAQVFNSVDKNARNYIKLLLGRIVFIKFLQKKGWMGVRGVGSDWQYGDPDFLFNLYNNFDDKDNFHSQALLPLFDHLNAHGDSDIFNVTNTKVPALNGGLFERQYDNLDTLNFKKKLFSDFFEFLDQYNFTIDESDPDDAEVGIDPEMLGHIFENLLEDNKDKGAFYTPKPIVKYMCQESIIEYLYTYFEKKKLLGDEKENTKLKAGIELFIKKHDCNGINDHEKTISRALKEIKVCDPAIGSGAFPMGILLEIFSAINLLYDEFQESTANVWKLEEWNPARIKEHIIQNSIYGVDIEKGAVDIARLRFWLSLIIDEDEPRHLPNLDYKIVVGNSLLPEFNDKVIEIDWSPRKSLQGKALELHTSVQNHLNEVVEAQRRYFGANNEQKEPIKQQIRNAKLQLIKSQTLFNKERFILSNEILEDDSNLNAKQKKENQAKKDELTLFDETAQYIDTLIADSELPFSHFDWKLDFPEILNPNLNDNTGFDIVIGNPPYVQLQKDSGYLAKMYESCGFATYIRTGDIYSLFYEKGFQILSDKGIHTFITSSQWIKAAYGRLLRRYFLNNNPLKLILLGPAVFSNATVDTNILIAQKGSYKQLLRGLKVDYKVQIKKLHDSDFILMNYISEQDWGIYEPLKQSINSKLKKLGKSLGLWDIHINFGIKTGFNEAFIIDEIKSNELLSKDPSNGEIIKPIIRGRAINTFCTTANKDFLINTHNGIKKLGVDKIDIDKYPTIKDYLNTYFNELKKRADQGDTPYNLRNCAYLEDFSKVKVIWKRIGSQLRFTYSEEEVYSLDSTCIATGEKIKYLTGLLNSKISQYQLFENAPRTGMGDLIISVQALEPLLVHYPGQYSENLINQLVDNIIDIKKKGEDSFALEEELNAFVFKLYDLTHEEVKLVYPEFSYNEAEYDAIELPEETVEGSKEPPPGIGLFAEGTLFNNPNNK